jgi:2,5-diketo-D-gluconate reductase B
MAVGRVFGDPVLQEIGKSRGKGVAQVVLRWLLQQGVIALSRTVSPEHVIGNIQVFDFVLASTEVAAIHGLAAERRIVNPQGLSPQWDPTPAAEGLTSR